MNLSKEKNPLGINGLKNLPLVFVARQVHSEGFL